MRLGYKYATYCRNFLSSSPKFDLSIHHQFATLPNTMMFMRTILALSFAAFTLAVPVAEPQLDVVLGDVGEWFCSSITHCYNAELIIECRHRRRRPSWRSCWCRCCLIEMVWFTFCYRGHCY